MSAATAAAAAAAAQSQVIYDGDERYPGPIAHPPPAYITGIPNQAELDAQARMFTWGELKEIVREYMSSIPAMS